MTTRHLRISGRVQGVWFRAWAAERAVALGLSGWVRNRHDGTVEMLLHGEVEAVERMIALARQGPPAARVEQVEIEESGEVAPVGFEKWPTV